jgi:hypothetical protein
MGNHVAPDASESADLRKRDVEAFNLFRNAPRLPRKSRPSFFPIHGGTRHRAERSTVLKP